MILPTREFLTSSLLMGCVLTFSACGDGDDDGDGSGGSSGGTVSPGSYSQVDTAAAKDLSEATPAELAEIEEAQENAQTIYTNSQTVAWSALNGVNTQRAGSVQALATTQVDVDSDGNNDISVTSSGSEQEGSMTITFLGDYSVSDEDGTYTIADGSSMQVDYESESTDSGTSIDMLITYDDYTVTWETTQGSGTATIDGGMDLDMTISQSGESFDFSGSIVIDLSMTLNGESIGTYSSVSFSGSVYEAEYYIHYNGSTYGPFTEAELETTTNGNQPANS